MLTSLCLLFCSQAFGQQISLDEARATARTILSTSASRKAKAMSQEQLSLAYQSVLDGNTHYYVFNSPSKDGGFVIIGGDKAARQILGFCEKGSFDYDQLPPNMKWWLSQYDEQIGTTISLVKEGKIVLETETEAKARRTVSAKSNVANFVETKWNQSAPYNSLIPSLGSGYTGNYALATGCVATAGAQAMKYYNYPSSGVGSHSYSQIWSGSIGEKVFSADFENTNYAWDKMQNTYTSTYSGTDAENAVATLMYHVGVACDMKYGQIAASGSSSNEVKLGMGMINYFKYDASMRVSNRSGYTDEGWEDMLYAEMAARRPVVYGGSTSSGSGHAFVISGFSKDEPYSDAQGGFYVNWGWGGSYNGIFPITGTVSGKKALTPDGTGIGGGASGSSYTSNQSMLHYIRPDRGGKLAINMHCTEYYVEKEGVEAASSTYITTGSEQNKGFFSQTLGTATITLGVKLESTSTGESVYVEGATYSIAPNGGYTSISYIVPASLSGTYKVYPAYKDEYGDWQTMEYPASQTIPTINVAEPASLYLTETAMFGNDGYTIYDGTNAESANITLKLKNNSGADINNKMILIWIYPENGGSSVTYFIKQGVSISKGQTLELNFNKGNIVSPSALSIGTKYTIKVVNYSDNTVLQNAFVTYFTPVNKATISYTLTSAGWGTICLPFNAEIPEGLHIYSVMDNVGSTLTLTEESEIKMNTPYLVSGTPATYTFVGPSTPVGDYTRGLLAGTTATDSNIPAESYILQNQDTYGLGFYKTTADRSARQYRAYLTKAAGESMNTFLFPDMENGGQTAIESLTHEDATPIAIYTLGGVQVRSLQKGVNIIRMSDNSVKKVLVK